MPNPDFSEQSDPWDSFARELGAEEATDADESLSPEGDQVSDEVGEGQSQEADVETEVPVNSPSPEAESLPDDSDTSKAVVDQSPQATEPTEPEEGSVDWNFLAQELGIKEAGDAPEPAENPADKLFADYTPSYIEPDEPDQDPADETRGDDPVEDGFSDGLVGESEVAEEKAKTPRRRGRRRSGRRRGDRNDAADGPNEDDASESLIQASDEPETEEAESSEKTGRRRRPRRRGRRGGKERSGSDESTAEESEVKADSGGATDSVEEEPKEPVKHRKIPTWGEAIGVVVEANLESRSKQPNAKPAKSRRGRAKSKSKR